MNNKIEVKFPDGQQMLDYIIDGHDLYCPELQQYVFAYNDYESICVYFGVDIEKAKELDKGDEYWGAYLSIEHNSIFDAILNINWCDYACSYTWLDVTK